VYHNQSSINAAVNTSSAVTTDALLLQPLLCWLQACLPLTSLAAIHDLVECLLHFLADGQDEVQHLAPVACHVMAQRLQLRLVVMDAAVGKTRRERF
jgi:hypothetical protein